MIWVCRSGKHGKDYDEVRKFSDVFMGWDGYRLDLSGLINREDFKELVIKEKNPAARTTISNWAGQLYSFCREMQKGDFVLVPNLNAKEFLLARIVGDYRFEADRMYPHVRRIEVLKEGISRSLFSQSTQYSLGAFRTVFKVRQEEEILTVAQINHEGDI
ncbi:MAG: hypothetical protein IKG46_00050 [Solobacterium sp.]|nr:hypothetical protein [Solobacterium sp.]